MIGISGTLLCIFVAGIGGVVWFTWMASRAPDKRAKWAGMLLIGLVAIVLIWLSIPLINIIFPSWFVKTVHIDVVDIPVYSNAQKVAREGPIETDYAEGEKHVWKFTTQDTPEEVWKFYKDEMERRWGFFESGSTDAEKILLLDSCPFYYLEMSSAPMENNFHEITISFTKELCR